MTNKFKQRENNPTLVIHSTDNSFGFGYRKIITLILMNYLSKNLIMTFATI